MLTGKTIGELTNLSSPTADTLIPVELSGATYNITYSSLLPYKVYTALLTQVGGDNPQTLTFDLTEPIPTIVTGVTYEITQVGPNIDFTTIGSPDNNVGTKFVATGTNPGSGDSSTPSTLSFNTGAPTVTVLENTIGNIWCVFEEDSRYTIKSNGLFTQNKSILTEYTSLYPYYIKASAMDTTDHYLLYNSWTDVNTITLKCTGFNSSGMPVVEPNNAFTNWFIEIRIYN